MKLHSTLFTVLRQISSNVKSKFLPLYLPGITPDNFKRNKFQQPYNHPPLYRVFREDSDWTNIWPTAKSFESSIVPLMVRQGYPKGLTLLDGQSPSKFDNRELMKIPNFLHLTPIHIKKQCKAIKKFCTKWPTMLTEEKFDVNFPLRITTKSYLLSSNDIRDKRARIVVAKLRIHHLNLNKREKSKFLQLLGSENYDKSNGEIVIKGDRCPTMKQNLDYVMYVLTALVKESKKFETWELELTEEHNIKEEFQNKFKKYAKSFDVDSLNAETEDLFEKFWNEEDDEDFIRAYQKLMNGFMKKRGVLTEKTVDKPAE